MKTSFEHLLIRGSSLTIFGRHRRDGARHPLRDERGVALVMAVLALMILSVLVLAFSVLSSTEPVIANNQLRVAQARALAEAGLERAVWALSLGKTAPGTTGSLANPLPVTVPAPYDGSQLVTVSTGTDMGGFRVTVGAGAAANERSVVSVGWVPTDDGADTRTKAHQRVTATLMNFNFNALNMPCAVCVRGDIQIGGNSNIDSRQDTSCGNRYGTWSTRVTDSSGTVVSPGNTTIGSGASKIYGADSNNTANQSTDMAVQQDQAVFDANSLTDADLNALKAYAKLKGTYYQGSVTFNASNKIPNGIIFVDTVSGNNLTTSTPSSDFASLSINGNPSLDSTGFHGWIVSNGSVSISGNIVIYGLVYAQNDMSYTGTGTGQVIGQMISRNIKDTIATVIDTSLAGNSSVTYNCAAATNPGSTVPQGFMLKAGTYRETSD